MKPANDARLIRQTKVTKTSTRPIYNIYHLVLNILIVT